MNSTLTHYLDHLLALYLATPGVAHHTPSPDERRLAASLAARQVPLPTIETAFLLAAARRSGRHLPPIRSLHYFLPLIEEVLANPPDQHYINHLKRHLALGDRPKKADTS